MSPRTDNLDSHACRGPYAIALDVGGTALKAGVITVDGRILLRTDTPTLPDRPPQAIEADLFRLHRRCTAWLAESTGGAKRQGSPVAAAISLPGLRSPDGRAIARADNLPTLNGYPLIANLRRKLGDHLVVDSDSRLAALADYQLGAGGGAARLAVATIGTGIGVAILIDGRPLPVTGLGRIEIESPIPAGSSPQTAPLEKLASAAALDRAVRQAAAADLEHDAIRAAIASGRGEASSAIRRWADALAAGIRAWHREYKLERVTIAGGLALYGEPLLHVIHTAVREHFTPDPAPDVLFSPLGPNAPLVGAALSALRVLGADTIHSLGRS
ncbi:MAG: ROK family protein [Phycisphaerales bacterium]|nr:MAG: ROK family protein [Phycisphaerales bacterium]